ncbi:MAG TPA: hypothetical protein VFL30_06245, partial [Rhodanobacteraceae bacterium]|nr:hypothetical protein [Rhodanobacteraceae bacterium]
ACVQRYFPPSVESQRCSGHFDDQQHVLWLRVAFAVEVVAAPQKGYYTLVDEPDLGTALELPALSGVAVNLERLFG